MEAGTLTVEFQFFSDYPHLYDALPDVPKIEKKGDTKKKEEKKEENKDE